MWLELRATVVAILHGGVHSMTGGATAYRLGNWVGKGWVNPEPLPCRPPHNPLCPSATVSISRLLAHHHPYLVVCRNRDGPSPHHTTPHHTTPSHPTAPPPYHHHLTNLHVMALCRLLADHRPHLVVCKEPGCHLTTCTVILRGAAGVDGALGFLGPARVVDVAGGGDVAV
jgi:hypothetical protein